MICYVSWNIPLQWRHSFQLQRMISASKDDLLLGFMEYSVTVIKYTPWPGNLCKVSVSKFSFYIIYSTPHPSGLQIDQIKSFESVFCYGSGFYEATLSLLNRFLLTCQCFVTVTICKLAGISEKILRFWWRFSKRPLKIPSKFLYLVQEEHFDTLHL